jgi:glycosyltransferase involved in cell wall biosynthesis
VRLAVVNTHPVQYYAPIFRELAQRADVTVFFAHRPSRDDQANAGFGVGFEWDIDFTDGFRNIFLKNVASMPNVHQFSGCDTPDIGDHFARGRFDAVLLMGWQSKCLIQALLACKRRGIPVMVRGDSHLETPRSTLKKAMKSITYPLFLRAFDAALYVGQRSRSYWLHYGYPPERLFSSPHCVDTEWFSSRATRAARANLRGEIGISRETKLVTFAGKLLPGKRPLDLVASVAKCRAAGLPIELVIAGDGPMRDELINAASTSAVPLHHLGFCNQSRMPAVYAASDVLVLPSSSETWGLVANEALACGCPIIVSDACGCALDLASDGQSGRRYPVGDTEALQAAITRTLTEPPTQERIGAKSKQYSVAAAVEGILAAADYVTGRSRLTNGDTNFAPSP